MERKQTPQERYDAKMRVPIQLRLNKKTDADILKRLEEVDSKQSYIKRLIQADIETKRGKWLDVGGYDTCSVCGFGCGDSFCLGDANYCPSCGTKMDAE